MIKFNDYVKKLFSKRSFILAIFVMILFTVTCGIKKQKALTVAGIMFTLLYFVVYALVLYYELKRRGMSKDSPLLSGLTLNFVTSLASPVAIVNNLGEIVWCNKAFLAAAEEKGTLYGKKLSDHFSSSLNAARLFKDNAEPVIVNMHGVDYEVTYYRTSSVGKGQCITLWTDITSLTKVKKELEMQSLMVAFVVIDNFSEAVQFVQD